MLKAMESGPGSISTTHARSAEHTIEKLVSCAMEKGPQVTRELAISKLAAAIDIVVYLRSEVVPNGDDGTFRQIVGGRKFAREAAVDEDQLVGIGEAVAVEVGDDTVQCRRRSRHFVQVRDGGDIGVFPLFVARGGEAQFGEAGAALRAEVAHPLWGLRSAIVGIDGVEILPDGIVGGQSHYAASALSQS